MASSNQTPDITHAVRYKLCSRCSKRKALAEFIRFYRGHEKEWSTCNECSEKKKGKRSESDTAQELLNQLEYCADDTIDLEEEIGNDEVDVLYELAELEELVTRHFANVDENEGVNFSEYFEFDDELLDHSQLTDDQNNTEEDRMRSIMYYFLLPIEAGTRYYWEIRKIYLHKKNSGQATVYLGCTQRIDRKLACPDSRSAKRISEARPPIDRYACKGRIVINIDFNIHRAKVTICHLIPHELPTYRENKIPERAIEWISNNLRRNLRKIEIYKRLGEEQLIDPKTHTYYQIYYWVSKFASQQYVTNASNQLLSSLNILKQPVLIDEGYKVLLYLENDFVRALGFLTPFNAYVSRDNINELVIDSTYKTNQEKFELFAVLINCGGYGVPLAYLYVDTFTAPADCFQDPRKLTQE